MIKKIYKYLIMFMVIATVACSDDEVGITDFALKIDLSGSSLSDYQLVTTFIYSTDGGTTFVPFPSMKKGQSIKVKAVYNPDPDTYVFPDEGSIEEISADFYEFDWSASNPKPKGSATAEIAEFVVTDHIDIRVTVTDVHCPFDPASFVGDWGGDEVGACCGGTDANTITQDLVDPNKLIMDNFWGDGVPVYMIFGESTNYYDQTVEIPLQVTAEAGSAWGTGTYDQCRGNFTIDTHYSWPGLSDLGVTAFAAASSSKVYAATGDGVFLSTNSGTYWALASTGLPDPSTSPIVTMAASGLNVFAGTSTGIFYSANSGTSWTAVNTGLTDLDVRTLVISGTNIFAGTNTGGVFISSNNGASWTATNSGLTNTSIVSLATTGTKVFAGTNGGAFYSADSGATWTLITTGLTNTYVTLAVSGANVFAGTSSGVFLSSDNGTTWTAVNAGLTNTGIQKVAASSTGVFAATSTGVFYSANSGTSWTAVNTGLTNTSSIKSLVATSATKAYVGTNGGGAFLTTNGGTKWSSISNGVEYHWQYNFHR